MAGQLGATIRQRVLRATVESTEDPTPAPVGGGAPDAGTRDDSQPPAPGGPRAILARFGRAGASSGILIAVVALIVVFSILSPYFFTYQNALVIGDEIATLGIVAAGATFVIITGGIDLSVGSVVAFVATLMGVLFDRMGIPLPIAMAVALAAGAVVGLVNGALIAYGHLAPFIATLATMSAVRGIANMLTNGVHIANFPDWFDGLATDRFMGLSVVAATMIVVFALGYIYLSRRPGGREIYAVGGNEIVSRLAGISVTRAKLRTYIVAGFLAGLGGVVLTARLDSATPNFGQGLELQVIAAVVIGGTSLSGGVGSIVGTVLGVLVIGILGNGLNLIGVSSFAQQVVIGFVIAGAVMLDSYRRRRA